LNFINKDTFGRVVHKLCEQINVNDKSTNTKNALRIGGDKKLSK